MRVGEVLTGAALVAGGGAVALIARGFPRMAGIAYGPDLFPTIAAAGLALCGLAIAAEGARAAPEAPDAPDAREPLAPGRLVALLAIVAGVALALPWLGFHLTFAAATLAASRVFGGGWIAAISLAAVAPPALHYVFYSLLRVPLPWGVLTPVAW